MVVLWLLWLVAAVALVSIVATQVVVPIILGTPWFPWFRRKAVTREVEVAREEFSVEQDRDEIARVRRQTQQLRSSRRGANKSATSRKEQE